MHIYIEMCKYINTQIYIYIYTKVYIYICMSVFLTEVILGSLAWALWLPQVVPPWGGDKRLGDRVLKHVLSLLKGRDEAIGQDQARDPGRGPELRDLLKGPLAMGPKELLIWPLKRALWLI